jgi:hypothetical protein
MNNVLLEDGFSQLWFCCEDIPASNLKKAPPGTLGEKQYLSQQLGGQPYPPRDFREVGS